MRYEQLPYELCAPGAWPRGPFSTADGDELAGAAATVGRLAAALATRRKTYSWSRAMLARKSGVGQYTIRRIETGRTWPDLVTVARLAHTLGMAVTMTSDTAPDSGPPNATTGLPVAAGPLPLGTGAVSAAQAIDLLFAHDRRLAAEVSALGRTRHRSAQGAAAAPAAAQVGRRG